MNRKFSFITFLVVILFSCKVAQNHSDAAAAKPGMLYSRHFKKPVISKTIYAATTEVIPIDTAYATGDSLHIITPKILACDADNFRLIWNKAYSTDTPARTTLKIFLATDPACNAKNQFHLMFNLKPLKQKTDSVGKGALMIRFGNYKRVVNYNY